MDPLAAADAAAPPMPVVSTVLAHLLRQGNHKVQIVAAGYRKEDDGTETGGKKGLVVEDSRWGRLSMVAFYTFASFNQIALVCGKQMDCHPPPLLQLSFHRFLPFVLSTGQQSRVVPLH